MVICAILYVVVDITLESSDSGCFGSLSEKVGYMLSKSRASKFPVVVILPDGNKLMLNVEDLSALSVLIGIYGEDYEMFCRPEKGDVVLDVGAHVGIFSLKAAKSVGSSGLVVAIEPDPVNFRKLVRNIYLNRYQRNVVPLRLALGKCEGYREFYCVSAYRISSTFFIKYVQACSTLEIRKVKTTTLDKLINEPSGNVINFLKVDVEGAERDVVEGGLQSFKNRLIKNFSIAVYHVSRGEQMVLLKRLISYGYHVRLLNGILYGAQIDRNPRL